MQKQLIGGIGRGYTYPNYLELSRHVGLKEITDGIRIDLMRIEVGAADVPWCVPCGNIMVLPHVITLAVQQVYKRECLLHAHKHAIGACIHNAIGIEYRPIEVWGNGESPSQRYT